MILFSVRTIYPSVGQGACQVEGERGPVRLPAAQGESDAFTQRGVDQAMAMRLRTIPLWRRRME